MIPTPTAGELSWSHIDWRLVNGVTSYCTITDSVVLSNIEYLPLEFNLYRVEA